MSDGEWAWLCVAYAVIEVVVAGLALQWAVRRQARLNRRAEQQLQARLTEQLNRARSRR